MKTSTITFTPEGIDNSIQNDADGPTTTVTSTKGVNPTAVIITRTDTVYSTPTMNNTATSAQISSSSSPQAGEVTHPSAKQFSAGALAGGIVGAFLGGCILAFLAAFFFFRSRKRSPTAVSQKDISAVGRPGPVKEAEEGFTQYVGTSSATALKGSHQQLDLAAFIPEPADDGSVSARIQTFFDQASLHIDNYYAPTVAGPSLNQNAISQLGFFESSFLSASLVTVLAKPQAQRAVLTHSLVQSTLNAIKPESGGLSLLPSGFALPSQRAIDASESEHEPTVFAWRLLTSHLYLRNGPSPIPDDQIALFAERFTRAFEPYSNPQFSEADRLRHLTSVVKAASELGIWLFSQPCAFSFRWTGATSSTSQVVTLPAVVKVGDEQGRRLAVPQIIVEKTISRV